MSACYVSICSNMIPGQESIYCGPNELTLFGYKILSLGATMVNRREYIVDPRTIIVGRHDLGRNNGEQESPVRREYIVNPRTIIVGRHDLGRNNGEQLCITPHSTSRQIV